MMGSFDNAAKAYDADFSFTHLGKIVRERTHVLFSESLEGVKGKKILELNGGTGEDALWLAKRGANITFTDASPAMIRVAQQKISQAEESNIQFGVYSFQEINKLNEKEFEVVFSNFGGLNCIDFEDLKKLSSDLRQMCEPGSRLWFVVMPPFFLWETLYFLLRLRFRKAFRRGNKKRLVNVNGKNVSVWFHSPRKMKKAFGENFVLKRKGPVGVAIPPSCLFSAFNNKPGWIKFFNSLESFFGRFSFLSGISDHYFVEFEAKK